MRAKQRSGGKPSGDRDFRPLHSKSPFESGSCQAKEQHTGSTTTFTLARVGFPTDPLPPADPPHFTSQRPSRKRGGQAPRRVLNATAPSPRSQSGSSAGRCRVAKPSSDVGRCREGSGAVFPATAATAEPQLVPPMASFVYSGSIGSERRGRGCVCREVPGREDGVGVRGRKKGRRDEEVGDNWQMRPFRRRVKGRTRSAVNDGLRMSRRSMR